MQLKLHIGTLSYACEVVFGNALVPVFNYWLHRLGNRKKQNILIGTDWYELVVPIVMVY